MKTGQILIINVYKNMPIEAFYQSAIQGGVDTGVDIKNLERYINNAKSIPIANEFSLLGTNKFEIFCKQAV